MRIFLATPRGELRLRLPRLIFGLLLCGLGLASMVVADLGLGPWDAFHQGISRLTGIPIGTVGIIVGFVVLAGWIPLREKLGLGTVLNAILIGATIDLTLLVLPIPEALWLRIVAMAVGPLLFGVGSGFYIGAGLGPGPRDGLMTGLARRGLPVGGVRTGIEVTVLALGWLLGGTIGVGTVVFATAIGPLVHVLLPLLSVPATPTAEPEPVETTGQAL